MDLTTTQSVTLLLATLPLVLALLLAVAWAITRWNESTDMPRRSDLIQRLRRLQ